MHGHPRFAAALLGGVVALTAAGCGSTVAPAPGAPSQTPAPLRPLGQQKTAADSALACPASISDREGMTVPQRPQGVDGSARLLPDRAPTSMVVCGYPVLDIRHQPSLAPPFKLARRTVVPDARRAEVTELLTWAPRGDGSGKACTSMGGNETAYLVGVTYADAIVWVAAKSDVNGCSNAANGDFVSRAAVGVSLDAMFGEGDPVRPATGACAVSTLGRLGDDQSLAPTGDPRVTVCRVDASGSRRSVALDAGQSRQVVEALRSLPVRPGGQYCEGAASGPDTGFRLVLTYAAGPPSVVNVTPGCTPPVLGGGVEAPDAGDLVSLVERWSPPVPGPDKDGSVSSDGSASTGAPGPKDGTGADPKAVPPVPGHGVTGAPGGGLPVPPDQPTPPR